jgi:conjugal transfer pilus assembly protein TraV
MRRFIEDRNIKTQLRVFPDLEINPFIGGVQMRRLLNLSLLLLFAIVAAGCASAMNPYDSNFTCPFAEKGKCVSLQTAYEESLKDNSGGEALRAEFKGKDSDGAQDPKLAEPNKTAYQKAFYRKVTNLLEKPETPMIVTSQALRVLVLPYKGDDNMLFMQRYVYFFVDDPRWVLDNLEAYPGGLK